VQVHSYRGDRVRGLDNHAPQFSLRLQLIRGGMPGSTPWLVCRVGTTLCALPIEQVIEVMRPLPVIAIAHAPDCVLGMCVMRGEAVPVVDVARCLSAQAGEPTRFVAVRAGARRIALAVDAVAGTVELSSARVAQVPPLLSAANAAMEAVSTLDNALLMLLESGRVLPDFEHEEFSSHARGD
jgi:purine-binding chemotaxis protein CheW